VHAGGEVHVMWRTVPAAPPEHAPACLSEDERVRFHRFRDASSASQFATGRLLLRTALGNVAGIAPEDVALRRDASGQLHAPDRPTLRFSLAHTHGLAIMAIAKESSVGIDIEHTSRQIDVRSIARRWFTAGERTALEQAEDAHRTFLEIWTCKEAVLKAAGHGIAGGLEHLDASPAGQQGGWVQWNNTAYWVAPIAFKGHLATHFVAALAVEKHPERIVLLGEQPLPATHPGETWSTLN